MVRAVNDLLDKLPENVYVRHIHDLPNEVLSLVFNAYVDIVPPYSHCRIGRLLFVCNRWQGVAQGNPAAWTQIVIHRRLTKNREVEAHIERSKGMDLRLFVTLNHRGVSTDELPFEDVFNGHKHRITAAEIHGDDPTIQLTLTSTLPRLRDLVVRTYDHQRRWSLIGLDSLSLYRLTIISPTFQPQPCHLPNLRSLILSDQIPHVWRDLLEFMSAAWALPNLEVLRFTIDPYYQYHYTFPWESPQPVTIPNLLELELSGLLACQVVTTFSILGAPKLQSLKLIAKEPYGDPATSDKEDWAELKLGQLDCLTSVRLWFWKDPAELVRMIGKGKSRPVHADVVVVGAQGISCFLNSFIKPSPGPFSSDLVVCKWRFEKRDCSHEECRGILRGQTCREMLRLRSQVFSVSVGV